MRIWKIEEIGECSLELVSDNFPVGKLLLPQPNQSFANKYGYCNYTTFKKQFGTEVKEVLHTPETVVIYFEDKIPYWVEKGMEVIL